MSMVSQTELGRQFAAGYDPSGIPQASNVAAEPHDHPVIDAVIRGYGHAVYAIRTTGGRLILCEGWRGYSTSTGSQLTKIAQGFRSAGRGDFDSDDDHRPGSRFGADDAEDVLNAIEA
jgi:hypothetical protein